MTDHANSGRTRVLITGAGGMLGRELRERALGADLEAVGLTRAELDITDPSAVHRALERESPDVVVNCAAWTDVDGAEQEPARALEVNGTGAGIVASGAAAAGAWTIHISSDYVFDGRKAEPYVESDPPGPLSAYGRSKRAGEEAVAGAAPHAHTIVRSSWLFGPGPCFPATILRLARERDELSVVDDQVGSPTFTGHLAQALLALARDGAPLGVLHLTGAGACSWFELAQQVVSLSSTDCRVRPVTTAEMPRPATRPAYSVLRSERIGVPELPHWRTGLEQFLAVTV